jgi:signal transduction histidine kinase/ActR/RegA family two-component response regulator
MSRWSKPRAEPNEAPSRWESQIRLSSLRLGLVESAVALAATSLCVEPTLALAAHRDDDGEVLDYVVTHANASGLSMLGATSDDLPLHAPERLTLRSGGGFVEALRLAQRDREASVEVRARALATVLPVRVIPAGEGFLLTGRHDPARPAGIGRIAARLAHEFNNQLQALRSALDGLALERVATPSANAELAAMRLAVVRMAANTRQLQVFTQQQVLQPVEIELNAWLEEMSWLLRGLVEDAATLEVALHDAPLRVRVDAAQLELAVINVVENARDAVELALRPGRVRVGAEVAELRGHAELDDGRYARLSVSDDGIGIAPESLEQIFQSDYSTKDELRGSGMGLANVRRVVRDAGGAVSVTSAPNLGARFDLLLPMVAREVPTAPNADTGAAPSAALARLLVVDDEATITRGAARLLGRLGYEVSTAASAGEALAILERGTPVDVLLTDFAMPGSSGADLLQVVRLEWPTVATILMSGHTGDPAVRAELLRSQTVFLAKPFSVEELLRAVERVLAVQGVARAGG